MRYSTGGPLRDLQSRSLHGELQSSKNAKPRYERGLQIPPEWKGGSMSLQMLFLLLTLVRGRQITIQLTVKL